MRIFPNHLTLFRGLLAFEQEYLADIFSHFVYTSKVFRERPSTTL